MGSYSDRVYKALNDHPPQPNPYTEVMVALQEFVVGVNRYLDKSAELTLQEGYLTAYGQEWRIEVLEKQRVLMTLFRAFVALDGKTHLDFSGGELVEAQGSASVANKIEEFLGKPEVQANLAFLKERNKVA